MTLPEDDPWLVALATCIDEGRPVDWDAAERDAPTPEVRAIVASMRDLAGVASAARQPLARGPDGSAQGGPPETRWGTLVVREAVGHGAFGTVYRATDELGRDVALKLLDRHPLDDELRARVLDEGRLLARLGHPNIVTVHGAGEDAGRVGLWMEFVEGRTLAAEVEAHGPLSDEEAATIGRKLCSALAAVHRAGFVHADVKAQNVMRAHGGRIVLMDFGAGQAVAGADPHRLTGTPLYLAPERLAGGAATREADIYSLGVLLYFLVTGTHPVEGRTREEVEEGHRLGRRIRLRDRRPELSDAFVRAVERAIEPDPLTRHASAGAFDAALAHALVPADGAARRPPPRWLVPAAVLAVGLASLAGYAGLRGAGVWGEVAVAETPAEAGATLTPGTDDDRFAVEARFVEVEGDTRRTLPSGARVAEGDAIELEIELSADAHVYVVNEDERGQTFLLFPLADEGHRNPLVGGRRHTLPGLHGSTVKSWQVTSTGGREHFFVIASRRPLPDVESAVAAIPTASRQRTPGQPGVAPSDRVGALRGVGGVVEDPVAGRREAPWHRDAKPLTAGREQSGGVWVRQVSLENPGR